MKNLDMWNRSSDLKNQTVYGDNIIMISEYYMSNKHNALAKTILIWFQAYNLFLY